MPTNKTSKKMQFSYNKALLVALQFIFFITNAGAQTDSIQPVTVQKASVIKQLIVPVSLITVGSLISGSNFEKSINKDTRNAVGNNFHTRVDDYLRFAPIVELYTADAFGIKAKNHWFDQSKNLAISLIVTDFITGQLKNRTHKTRPNGAEIAHSFPSAHSSFAFANATVVYKEFKESSPLVAYSAYGFATATGALRLANNAHWVSDVLAGAGIGILVTKIVYLLDPLIRWNPFINTQQIILLPQINSGQYGVYISKQF